VVGLSAWLGWAAFICGGVATAIAQIARINDPDESFRALFWGMWKWKHIRRGLPFALAALALLAAAGIAALSGH
jgi:hypothetical protein